MGLGASGAMLSDSPSRNDITEPLRIDVPADADTCTTSPLQRVRQALERLEPGQTLEISTHVREHTFTVTAWIRRIGLEIVSAQEEGRNARILVRCP